MNQLPAALLAPMAIAPGWRDAMAREWMRWTPGARLVTPGKAAVASASAAEPAVVDGSGGLLRVAYGVGVISVNGPLTNDNSEWAEFITTIFGGTQYSSIWRALEMARSMSQVQRILMRFGTPGGDADGCGQLGRFIYETRQVKPVRAHVDTLCASAGLWLASQCEEISSVAEGELGSIGVRCSWIDFSKFDEQLGIERGECISSLSPGKRSLPFDDEVKGRIQARIDDLAELFVAAVARGRDTDRETVITQYGAGDVMIASRALEAGLVDEVCDFNQALTAFAAAPTSSPEARASARAERKATTMQTKPKAGSEDTNAGPRCAKCDADVSGKSVYCATCYDDEPDGDEDASALSAAGLRGKTRSETRGKLVAFAQSVLEATGAKTGAAAIVKVISAVKAEGDLSAFVAESAKVAATARSKAVSDKLGAAIDAGKVTLGMVSKEVPILSGAPKAKVRESLAAITTQDASSVVGAVVSAGVTEEFAASVDEWLDSKGASALPAAHRQPGAADQAANAAVKPPAISLPGDPAGTPLSIDSVLKKAAEAKK